MNAGVRATQEQLPVGQSILGQAPRRQTQVLPLHVPAFEYLPWTYCFSLLSNVFSSVL